LFVKREKYLGKNEEDFKPRGINGATETLKAFLGPEFNKLTHLLADRYRRGKRWVYACGMRPSDLGLVVMDMDAEYSYCYECDVSNWDGSMDASMLELEKYFILTKLKGLPVEFVQELIDEYTNIRCST
jgi:hypothetical protein